MPSCPLMEHLSCTVSCLPGLLNSPVKKVTYGHNPIIKNSLKIWSQILTFIKATKLYLSTPICSSHAFKPGMVDPVFLAWREKGIGSFDVY